MLIAKWSWILALSAALAAPALQAEPFSLEPLSSEEDTGFSLNIAPGRRIVVQHHKGLGKKVKGEFVGSDAYGVTVDTKQGIRDRSVGERAQDQGQAEPFGVLGGNGRGRRACRHDVARRRQP